ncbi:hypothetical protein Tsubulata_019847 [Turnera subulata]|uniref:Uncharacterized protein n=1 Tax=Turnera subulata TaxID=218843 RepID=A0A9Q0EXN3_9ROSI|nr:hypothetical protein Tsubulata_019847 [Turnera subulata]
MAKRHRVRHNKRKKMLSPYSLKKENNLIPRSSFTLDQKKFPSGLLSRLRPIPLSLFTGMVEIPDLFMLGLENHGAGYRDSIDFIRSEGVKDIDIDATAPNNITRSIKIPVLPAADRCPPPKFYDVHCQYVFVVTIYRFEYPSTYCVGFKARDTDLGPSKKDRWYYFSDIGEYFSSEQDCVLVKLPFSSTYVKFLGLERLQKLQFSQPLLCHVASGGAQDQEISHS